ncbi:MAG: hypothetical protein MUC96_17300 [Myxococcaceae bacterium]|jgi:hypothetical protein|nr:hypothetical protein [Myxococcaceae bacterium]
MVEGAAVETCPRCGTFAPLVDTGLKRVCGPCVEPSLHPIQRARGDVVRLLAGLWQVMGEFGWLLLVLLAALLAPWWLYAPLKPATWLPFLFVFLSMMSAAEALTFLVWRDRRLRGRPVEWSALAPAIGRVWVANLVLGLLSLFCSPVAFLFGPISSVVALAALERRGALDAIRTAWARSDGGRVGLVVAYLITFIPMVVATVVAGGLVAAFLWFGGARGAQVVEPAAVAALVGMSVGMLPAVVLQAAAWLSTLPGARPAGPP